MSHTHLDHHHDIAFPRAPLIAAGSIVLGTLLLVAFIRITGLDVFQHHDANLISAREVRFEDDRSGAVNVYDAARTKKIGEVAPGVGGFVRATLRGLGRERKRQGVSSETVFRLALWSDGRFTLEDPATDRKIDLGAFGPTNANAFARFLEQPTSHSVMQNAMLVPTAGQRIED